MISPIRIHPLLLLLLAGVLVVAACSSSRDESMLPDCRPSVAADESVARVWDDVLLDAIRRDVPAPTVHSRNLFHLSAAMWDAWAAYDPVAVGYFVDEDHTGEAGDRGDGDAFDRDVEAARETAISFAAYRILIHRYADAAGAEETKAELDRTMESLCYASDYASVEGSSPAALGNRIAAAVIDFGLTDGSHELEGYAAPGYEAVNEPLIVAGDTITMADPNRWQPLALDVMETQSGQPLPTNVQEFIGPYWGEVAGFALPPSGGGLPLDPGDPPRLGDPATDAAFTEAAVEVIRYSATLDPGDATTIDISPAAFGANPLGTNDGTGHSVNPATGIPYAPNVVSLGDFGRVVAEFWADGPASETPPGHWNTIANAVSDAHFAAPDEGAESPRIGGVGEVVDRLEWDVKLYLALNGAVHDAAVAAWGAKGHYDYPRPISMIRYMSALGQSTDPAGPAYDPDGLPLVDGLIEVITAESSGSGERHEHLREHVGEVAIKAWAGNPDDPETGFGGVGWIRAVEWVPYQRPTFVTPSFAGYVSGHSAFSRAAAEVLARFTGSEYFPNGLGEATIDAGGLEFEAGPADDLTLQWATYDDAADQAGTSRLYGGIHVRADDFAGRVMGATCGIEAWELAVRYFDGSIAP